MKSIICISLILAAFYVDAQEMYMDAGKIISTFNYTNSDGEKLDLLKSTNNSIGFGLRGPFKSTGERLYLNGGLSINQYGASGTDLSVGNGYEWDVTYLGLNVGLDYDLAKLHGFQVYIKAMVAPEFFLQGTQKLNNQYYNLKRVEQFDGVKVFVKGGAGISYSVKDNFSVFVHYLAANNFFNLGEDKSDGEKLRIFAHHITVGVFIRLGNFRTFK